MPQQNIYQEVLNELADIICIQDKDGTLMYCNHPDKIKELNQDDQKFYHDVNGHYYTKSEKEIKIGDQIHQIIQYNDSTEIYSMMKRLEMDEVTDLPVRSIVQKSLKEIDQDCAIAILDIDHFKKINDTYGHPYGDQVLAELTSLLKNKVREDDFVGRYGGEEFLVIIKNPNFFSSLKRIDQIREEIEEHFSHPKMGNITVSIGISSYKEGDCAIEKTVEADKALYYVKEHGRNNSSYFDPNTQEFILTRDYHLEHPKGR